jgi:hypothetical protein
MTSRSNRVVMHPICLIHGVHLLFSVFVLFQFWILLIESARRDVTLVFLRQSCSIRRGLNIDHTNFIQVGGDIVNATLTVGTIHSVF